MKFIYRLGTAAAAASLIGAAFTTAAFAGVTAEISGNGSDSNNEIKVELKCDASLHQSNKTTVNTDATVIAKTGNNEASGNTGASEVTVDSGNATASLTVDVGGSSNTATAPNCCECLSGPVDATIADNGTNSTNKVSVKKEAKEHLRQRNRTRVRTTATVKAKTGKNKANNNTGAGIVDVNSGNAQATTSITVDPSSNNL